MFSFAFIRSFDIKAKKGLPLTENVIAHNSLNGLFLFDSPIRSQNTWIFLSSFRYRPLYLPLSLSLSVVVATILAASNYQYLEAHSHLLGADRSNSIFMENTCSERFHLLINGLLATLVWISLNKNAFSSIYGISLYSSELNFRQALNTDEFILIDQWTFSFNESCHAH